MTEYFPKAEQIDTLNGKLDALNETLKKREDFVSAVAKMESATAEAQTAATNANTAAAGVVSPTVTTSKADGVTTVTITDKDGAHTATIEDGAKGDTGAEALRATKNYAATYTTIGCDASWSTDFFNRMPVVGDIFTNIDASSNTGTWKITSVSGGLAHFTLLSYVSSKGADGYSPTATVTKSGTTTTVTVTDKTGTTTAEVKDGSDATVTKDAIVDALGYEPVKPEGNYELIKSVTTTEDSVLLAITEDSSGKAFELVHGYICITCPSTVTTSRNGGIYWHGTSDDGTLLVSMYTKLFTGNTGKVYYWLHNRGSYVETFYEAMNSGNSNADSTAIFSKPFSNPHINEARLYMENIIPAGATIELYGIRA